MATDTDTAAAAAVPASSEATGQVGSASASAVPVAADAVAATTTTTLPENRFELELEFLQALASPAYLHYLATSRDTEDASNDISGAGAGGSSSSSTSTSSFLQDPQFQQFLIYLRETYSQPEYARFLQYPHSLYFLNVLIEQPHVIKEWTLPAFRNFVHQQQFLAWQYRHATYYGVGSLPTVTSAMAASSNTADETM